MDERTRRRPAPVDALLAAVSRGRPTPEGRCSRCSPPPPPRRTSGGRGRAGTSPPGTATGDAGTGALPTTGASVAGAAGLAAFAVGIGAWLRSLGIRRRKGDALA